MLKDHEMKEALHVQDIRSFMMEMSEEKKQCSIGFIF